ncbi:MULTISPECIES: phospho-N-acetylmuramoyl-pentapeptide-transferase [Auritidibacter]|uniref:phospho-N-acetylmuramoyl-pentapeptide- transferase n=1 Tax=Auritidibacter TaxID=1160973 RepID=UPI000D72B2CB|nr:MULTISPECIES: phospho-N-acetylmuramoyl-pentapeptide-transferase [Auritidibacter]AXR73708.1 phospho-N-acetylmuramoyl-pentapeptide-transferase [Auritidibacter sp. NML130574]NIH70368.1 phospho-N-acetylmuramoyl-pentapeptide-transferase [Auritidibacter ignavus]PXA76432.1 phospho-N-acetylmuramoyl-pentapeptide-transferase [Auritidibacter sp. NML100628]PXA81570.1 phospho-N-acetylmuramoyl-pentapeptide-transferase [Auritidibacter sp. NML120636]RMX23687.1 phospho-N-acetylmuramoyl-pentapeptide-transfer
MIGLLIGLALGLVLTLIGTPLLVKVLVKKHYGQFIREDGPTSHQTKRGTPTMGGAVIVGNLVIVYFLTHGIMSLMGLGNAGVTASGLLLLFLTAGMGLVGFFDDFAKISNQRSLGLTAWAKIILQGVVGIAFAILVLNFPDDRGLTPGSTAISVFRDTSIDLAFAGPVVGVVLFVIWSNLITTATTNAVNLTDGLDGLATGAVALVTMAYGAITVFQLNQACGSGPEDLPGCYQTRDPMDLALLAAILTGCLIGFLWWNTNPAKIFMGDTGSLALGGALAGFAILSRTELLLVVLAGLMVAIALSVIIQVGYFKLSGGKRVFLMAPLQHHFELKGWAEVTVVVRFWLVGLVCALAGLAMFYAEWVIVR